MPHPSFPSLALLATTFAVAGCPSKPDEGATAEKAAAETKASAPATDPGPAGPLGPLPAGPVAVVGGEPITMAAFRAVYDLKLKKYENRRRPMTKRIDRRYRTTISERLVWAELLRRECEARELTADPAQVDALMEQDRLGTREWAKDLLRRGESDDTLRELHLTQVREKLILEREGALAITPAEIDEEIEKATSGSHADKPRVQIAQIVIETNDKVTIEQAREKATAVFEQARAEGADFGELAKQHSDVVTRQTGGDLGIQRIDRMDQQILEVVEKLKPGEVSKPVETPSGIQLIKLIAKFEPGTLPREALEPQLRGFVYNRKLQTGRVELRKRLGDKYGVEDRMAAHLAGLAD